MTARVNSKVLALRLEKDAERKLPGETDDVLVDPHIYEGERCIFCNVNTYDDGIYGPFECITNRPLVQHQTETPTEGKSL
jgi:hypothetical protein